MVSKGGMIAWKQLCMRYTASGNHWNTDKELIRKNTRSE